MPTTDQPPKPAPEPTGEARPADTQAPEAEIPARDWSGWPVALAAAVALVVFDQITKVLAVRFLAPPPAGEDNVYTIIPDVFYLDYAENRGAAFSIFYGHVEILALISIAASVWISWIWAKVPPTERLGRWALVSILGGAIGNLIDRVRLGYVVDMFDAYIFSYDYPVFNVADSLIFIGVVVLLIQVFRGKVNI